MDSPFHVPESIATGGRFTYSSQIDWAPVFATTDPTATGLDAQRIEGRETFGDAYPPTPPSRSLPWPVEGVKS